MCDFHVCVFFCRRQTELKDWRKCQELSIFFLCIWCVNPFANRFIGINANVRRVHCWCCCFVLTLYLEQIKNRKVNDTSEKREKSLSSVYDTKWWHRCYRKNKRNHTLHMLFLHSSQMKNPEAKPRQTHDYTFFSIHSIQLYLLYCVREFLCVLVLALFLFICGTFSQIT